MQEPTDLMFKLSDEIASELNLNDKETTYIENEYEKYLDPKSYRHITCTYYGEPKAQARARATGNFSHFYDPDKSFKQFLNEQIRYELGNAFKPIISEIYFTARFYKTTPKKYKRRDMVLCELGVIRPTVKPDIDNYEKLVYDGLKGLLYTDDSLIIHGSHTKYFSCKPRVELEIYFRV